MSKAEEILKRFKSAQSRKTQWDETYQDAMEYAAPQRETFDYEFKGQRKDGSDNQVYDSTAQDALFRFASNLQSSLVPPMKKWIKLSPGPLLDNPDQMAQALDTITEVLFTAIHNSNFDTQVSESFLDLGFGTGALLIFKGTTDNPFEFVNVPLSQLYLEEGANGRIDTAFRKFTLAARAVEKQWPDAQIGEDLGRCIEETPDKELTFIEATIPTRIELLNRDTNQMEMVEGYVYSVIEERSKSLIVERKLRRSPWVIFRWANLPGEIYGRGPVLNALPDIKSLNKTKELLLQAASIATFGMYTLQDDGMINPENIKFGPAAVISVASNPGSLQGASLAPLQLSGNPNLTQMVIEDLRNSINKMMFGDPLGDVNLPVKTATEISLRQQDLAKRIGSAFGKLQFELIHPLVNTMLGILDDLGLVDLGPFIIDGNVIAIDHVSPLAVAQDEEEVITLIRYAETIISLFGPQAGMAMINPDKFSQHMAKLLDINPDIPISEEQAGQIKQMLMQQAAQNPEAAQEAISG